MHLSAIAGRHVSFSELSQLSLQLSLCRLPPTRTHAFETLLNLALKLFASSSPLFPEQKEKQPECVAPSDGSKADRERSELLGGSSSASASTSTGSAALRPSFLKTSCR